ncbi:MAG: CRISPR-associated helicase Cas3' [Gammaproteobacteria bacterium]|nr:CRISPR-associated helicase Cas3' [Gammaproteobacteria bacterium]
MNYYAHSHDGVEKKEWHLLSNHLKETGIKAASFLDTVGCADLGMVAGLLHDLGKYSLEFQNRLTGSPTRVNHSTAGARIAIERYGEGLGKLLAFCIAGHHTGLANGVHGKRITALEYRLLESIPVLDPVWEKEIPIPSSSEFSFPQLKLPDEHGHAGHSIAFLVRMLFSALVDADYLDTEAWFAEKDGKRPNRGEHIPLVELKERLSAFLEKLSKESNTGFVNELRREILVHARGKASDNPGLFSLTVPTGGGKTLTSLAFALDHAVVHGLGRVIYVIPYTSIVEQTAAVFREALSIGQIENDPIVEHHSTFDEERMASRESREKLQLAMENWDAPIIVTTSVQFFESLFANRPSRCRKLHNIANSVVILDEAQTLPLKYLKPCVAVIDELARNWRTSLVLCTATQPALGKSDGFDGGLKNVREIAPEPSRLQKELRRTRIVREGQIDDEELSRRLESSPQVLCIVNTRRHARELYESVKHLQGVFHLSTLMCARHRTECLDAVRRCLKAGEPVRLISTSLVEAGVDLDFPSVWRAAAGLESIIQAAGRCNREGRLKFLGEIHVFEPAPGEGRKPPPEIDQYAAVARSIFRGHDDPMDLKAIRGYFQELYWLRDGGALDVKEVLPRLERKKGSLDFPFEEIANDFRLIESPMVPVIVPWAGYGQGDDSASKLIDCLQWIDRPGSVARKLQPFVVQIPQQARGELLNVGAVDAIREGEFGHQFVVLRNMEIYSTDTGLSWDDPLFRTVENLIF